jgi:hypothetical protein
MGVAVFRVGDVGGKSTRERRIRARRGLTVRGLTTAASIWVTAAIGILVGIGFWFAANRRRSGGSRRVGAVPLHRD